MLEVGEHSLLSVRLAAVAVCLGAASVFDDPAAATVESSPTPLLFRRVLRVALVVPLLAALWAAVLGYAETDIPAWPLTLELAAMLAVTLAAAAFGGAVVAAPTLLVLLGGAAVLLPDRWTLFSPGPVDPGWDAAHKGWAAMLVAAALALLYASLDPGRSRFIVRVRVALGKT